MYVQEVKGEYRYVDGNWKYFDVKPSAAEEKTVPQEQGAQEQRDKAGAWMLIDGAWKYVPNNADAGQADKANSNKGQEQDKVQATKGGGEWRQVCTACTRAPMPLLQVGMANIQHNLSKSKCMWPAPGHRAEEVLGAS